MKPPCILVIEKNKAVLKEVVTALKKAGYSVVSASNAQEGMSRLCETTPDVIVMTRELPLVNGEEPCLRVRQATYVPLLIMGNEEEAVDTLELGADAYMTEPPDLRELVARVRALLRRKQMYGQPPGISGDADYIPGSAGSETYVDKPALEEARNDRLS